MTPDRTIKSLNKEEFEIYWRAIETNEGWDVGKTDPIPRWVISGVHKKQGSITEYLVKKTNKAVWVPKLEAIKLAQEYRLRATLVHMKTGTMYLRPEYAKKPFQVIV